MPSIRSLRYAFTAAICALLLAPALPSRAQSGVEIPSDLKTKLISAGLSPRALDVITEEINRTGYARPAVGIVDYTLASELPRFFVIRLRQGDFKAYPVSHGTRSGGRFATAFSNQDGSHESALGFIHTAEIFSGHFGRSMRVEGVSASNSRDQERAVLIHSAEYSSPEFFEKYGFWGRSFACMAVPQKDIDEVINTLGVGALVLAYHDKLWDETKTHPESQSLPGMAAAPAETTWEREENNDGDPHKHQTGDGPTAYYKTKFGAE